jgi:hypothetical protein
VTLVSYGSSRVVPMVTEMVLRRRRVAALTVGVAGMLVLLPSAATGASYVLRARPTASFVWYPHTPRVGEEVSLVSTSSDLASAITGWAWDVSGNASFGPFVRGGPTAVTRFSTPAPHTVRLRVTAADGGTDIGEATIHMGSPAPNVISPFPIVRIVGRNMRRGVHLRLVAVRAPRRSAIKIRCAGARCPAPLAHRAFTAFGRGASWVRFTRFARSFSAGVKLEIMVSRGGEIGAYTGFTVRRRGLPVRRDSCLGPVLHSPVACPAG